ncbi:VOC family protein [Streptomyces sp. NPDC088760]|uniref:VOC family protein n=1 Tax=Streptomyces sp. NPDC088760 TaxID=3365890 RepID=UPI0037F5938E
MCPWCRTGVPGGGFEPVTSWAMNEIPPLPDHLVLATPDLGAAVAGFVRRTGVVPVPGGVHVGLGTRHHLVGGAGRPELSGDPRAGSGAARARRAAAVRRRPAGPSVPAWVISPPGLDAAVVAARARGRDPGAVRPMSRRTREGTLLRWRLTDAGPGEASAAAVPHRLGRLPAPGRLGSAGHPAACGAGPGPGPSVGARPPRCPGHLADAHGGPGRALLQRGHTERTGRFRLSAGSRAPRSFFRLLPGSLEHAGTTPSN